ncbi:MAG TPA: dihydrofolate reductase family protein [Paludibacter sp.]|nr:dihydrofolate reductase family protein [Paludibacter sp.]
MNKPKVILQVTASLDGRISFIPNSTMFTPIDDSLKPFILRAEDWNYFNKKVKSLHDIDFYLEGSNMLVSETSKIEQLPEYTGCKELLYQDYLPDNIVFREGRKTWTSVVDGRGRFRNGYKAYKDNPESYMIHLTSYSAPPEYLAFLQKEEIPYLITGKDKVDLTESFDKLYNILNVRCILTSSGGKLSGALIRENLLDEINILFQPTINGGFQTPVLFNSPDIEPPKILPSKLKYIESHVFDSGAIWVRYEVI